MHNRVVTVRDLEIGRGQPKICIPIVAGNIEELKKQAKKIMLKPADLVEFRIDHLEWYRDPAFVITALKKIREILENKPVIATFRTAEEGGEQKLSGREYAEICELLICSGLIDLIDLEYSKGMDLLEPLIRSAAEHQVRVILSSHNFRETPPLEDMVRKMKAMKACGADIVKLAVMPQSPEDVLRLLEASLQMKKEEEPVPLITISMSAMGMVTRLAGELTGSSVTFASAGRTSAPGQFDADELDRITSLMHRDLVDQQRENTKDPATGGAGSGGSAGSAGGSREKGENRQNPHSNIILIGFMGAGKSTVSRYIAEETGLEVVEMDEAVEEAAGLSIAEIFEQYGEAHFRDLETQQAEVAAGREGVIVSCGGGTVLRPQNVEILKSSGTILFLRAGADTVYERVRKNPSKRPLLARYMSRGYISCLMKKRYDTYLSVADHVVDVDGKTSAEVAKEIMDIMGLEGTSENHLTISVP